MTMTLDDADLEAGRNNVQSESPPPSPPRVSIGMPVFNGMRYIERAVTSLLAQSFGDFELIIVDNASTDGTYEFARTLTKDPRVRVERNDHNIRAIPNFIKAVGLARGEYFMWAAVDDLWEPAFVARLVGELDAHPSAGLAMSAIRAFREDGRTKEIVRFIGLEHPAHMSPLRLALKIGSLQKWSYFIYGLFRRPLLQQAVRYFPEGGAPDRILLAQVALNSGFRYVDEVLYQRQLHRTLHEDRYPDEAYSRVVAMGLLGDLHFVWSLCLQMLSSPVVPLRRKPFVPLIGTRYAATRIRARLFPRSIPQERQKALVRNLKASERNLRKARRQLERQQKTINSLQQENRDKIGRLERRYEQKVRSLDEKKELIKRLEEKLDQRAASAENPDTDDLRYPKFKPFTIGENRFKLLCSTAKEAHRVRSFVSDHAALFKWLAQTLRPADVFVDIGAGVGVQTVFAAVRIGSSGSVHAFEPHLADVSTLLRNVEANCVSAQVHAACTHLLDCDEVAVLSCASPAPADGNEASGSDASPVRSGTSALMHSCRLDTLIDRGIVPVPTIVSITAKGLEARVVNGMEKLLRSPDAPRFVQIAVGAATRDAIVSRMASAGYEPVFDRHGEHGEAARPDSEAPSYVVFARRQ